MRLALRLAKRGYGRTSPNPMVGAVLVRKGKIIGQGFHHGAGRPHAEIEAIRDARSRGQRLAGATLYVSLEPCSTQGRTPPCTEAIVASGISRVFAGATDPNPLHAGRGFQILRKANIEVETGILADEATRLNEAFNHWIVQHTPFVTVKAAMTLDGKISTVSGQSQWITSEKARAFGMKLRRAADAILVGVNTVLSDNPRLTIRPEPGKWARRLRRIILDSQARTPLESQVVADSQAARTTIVVSASAPAKQVAQLAQRVEVITAPVVGERIDLDWLLTHLGRNAVTHLLVEGGGEVNASFLLGGYAQCIQFFYAPKIIGGRDAPSAVAGVGIPFLRDAIQLRELHWRRMGADLLLTARVASRHASRQQ